jgi:hypothetical protein
MRNPCIGISAHFRKSTLRATFISLRCASPAFCLHRVHIGSARFRMDRRRSLARSNAPLEAISDKALHSGFGGSDSGDG